MDFDKRLAAQLRRVAVGLALGTTACSGGNDSAGELIGVCEEGEGPGQLVRAEGIVTVPLGADCPKEPGSIDHLGCCPILDFEGQVCGLVAKHENQVIVDTYYGSYFTDADEVTTSDPYGYPTSEPLDVCVYTGVYTDTGACCGRPLIREGEAVVAGVRAGGDWSEAGATWTLPVAARRAIAAYWLAAARLEHASVASFAQFTLDLMRFGAPPELLTLAQRAGLDEVDHAQRCFALVERATGERVGPGPMPLDGQTGSSTLADFAEALVREGCVGETLAALDAGARLREATVAEVRQTLEVIQRDEAQHASLAWKTLKWVLSLDADGAVRGRVAQVLAEERAAIVARASAPVATDPAERAHGLISAAERDALFLDGFDRVVLPAWKQLAGPLSS